MPHWESGLCEPCIQQAPASNRKTPRWTWNVSRNPYFFVRFVWYFDGDVVWSLFGCAKETLWENIVLVHLRLGQFRNGGILRLCNVGCIIALMLFPLQPYTAISLKKVLQKYLIGFWVESLVLGSKSFDIRYLGSFLLFGLKRPLKTGEFLQPLWWHPMVQDLSV